MQTYNKIPGVQKVFELRHSQKLASPWWREWLQYYVLFPEGIDRKMKPLYLESHFQTYPPLAKGSYSHKTF